MAIDREALKRFEAAPAPRQSLSGAPAEPSPAVDPVTPVATLTPEPSTAPVVDPPAASADSAPAPAPASAPADPAPASEPQGDPAPVPRSQERIEDLNAQLKATREYAEYQAGIIKDLTARTNGATPAPVAPADDPAPTLEQHEFDAAKLAKAQAEWLDRQVNKRVAAAMQQQTAEQQAAATRQQFASREEAFRAATPDYDVVVANPTLPALGKDAAKLVIASERGPQIVYHLAKNPNVAAHIARMTPQQQAMALGRLEAQLSAPVPVPAAQKRTTTQAPPPPSPAPTGGASGAPRDPSKMTMKEFVEAERRAAAERRARRGKH